MYRLTRRYSDRVITFLWLNEGIKKYHWIKVKWTLTLKDVIKVSLLLLIYQTWLLEVKKRNMQDHEGFITKPRKRKWSPSQHHGLEDFYSDRKAYSKHFLVSTNYLGQFKLHNTNCYCKILWLRPIWDGLSYNVSDLSTFISIFSKSGPNFLLLSYLAFSGQQLMDYSF